MRAVRLSLASRLQLRTCLRCGYRGPELQGEEGERTLCCPACDEDLCARPARSYAELEGLDEAGAWLSPWPLLRRPQSRLGRLFSSLFRALGRAMFQYRR